jgi:prepilin-type N-terminal cleavage/methylation domain-containing protein
MEQRAFPGRPRQRTKASGFTLLEVIVAMAVAAILASSLLTMQSQSAKFQDISRNNLHCINLLQEILAVRYPNALVESPSFVSWSGAVKGAWRQHEQTPPGASGIRMIELEAQNGDYSMTWRWLEAVQASLSENP